MYIIINKTKNTIVHYTGNFSSDLDEDLEQGDLIIIISTYSNTIKVPIKKKGSWGQYWDWIDYKLPIELLTNI
jgi:hypothetical protein